MNMMPTQGRAALTTFSHRHFRYAGCDKQVETNRRRDHADLHVHNHDDAEMNGVDAEFDGNRKHQWGNDYQKARMVP